MSRAVLTDAKVRALRPGAKRFDVWDAVLPSLIVHVTPRGAKSFMLKRKFPGYQTPTRRRIGDCHQMTVTEARAAGRQWLTWLERGIDPAHELKEQARLAEAGRLERQATTFAVVAEDYVMRRLSKFRRGQAAAQTFRSELLPKWKDKLVSDITRRDIVQLIEGILDRPQQRSGAHARKVLNHVRSFFNWAIQRDIYGVTSSPCAGIKPKDLIGPAKTRERVLDNNELAALVCVCDDIGYPYGDLVKLLVMTGCRKNEVAGARWSEFDFAAKTWTIPAARYKTDTMHTIPLTDDMVALLNELPRFKHGDFLFSTTFGRKPVNGWSKAKARLDRLMREQLGELPQWQLHDARRTMRTRMAEMRIPDHIAEAALGHQPKGIVAVYNKARYSDELREAFETWQVKLRSIIDPPADNVRQLKRRA